MFRNFNGQSVPKYLKSVPLGPLTKAALQIEYEATEASRGERVWITLSAAPNQPLSCAPHHSDGMLFYGVSQPHDQLCVQRASIVPSASSSSVNISCFPSLS